MGAGRGINGESCYRFPRPERVVEWLAASSSRGVGCEPFLISQERTMTSISEKQQQGATTRQGAVRAADATAPVIRVVPFAASEVVELTGISRHTLRSWV